MILLDDVVHILARPALTFARQELFAFEIADSTDVSGALVDIDHSWGGDVGVICKKVDRGQVKWANPEYSSS